MDCVEIKNIRVFSFINEEETDKQVVAPNLETLDEKTLEAFKIFVEMFGLNLS